MNLESISETNIMNKNIKEDLDKTLIEPELTSDTETQKDWENFINSGKKLIIHFHHL